TLAKLFRWYVRKFRIRTEDRPSTTGRELPDGGRARPFGHRARRSHAVDRRRPAAGRSCPAAASLRRDAGVLDLPPGVHAPLAPCGSRRGALLPCLWGPKTQIEIRSICCSSGDEAPSQARRRAGAARADPQKATTLAAGLLSPTGRRTSLRGTIVALE